MAAQTPVRFSVVILGGLAWGACGGRSAYDPSSPSYNTELRGFTPQEASDDHDDSRVIGVDGRASQVGMATWYGEALRGHKTASGERFNPDDLTAAHRTLPLGTELLVERLDNGAKVVVRVNDRGPFGDKKRIIDVSKHAAHRLDMIRAGVIRVRITVAKLGAPTRKKK